MAVLVGDRLGLAGVARDHDAADGEAHAAEDVHEAKDVLAVGDADVRAPLALLDVVGVEGEQHLGVVGELVEHAGLGVGREAGEHAAGVVVIEELSAELEVELAPELVDALANVRGLHLDVLVVVKADLHAQFLSVPEKQLVDSTTPTRRVSARFRVCTAIACI